jgi:beta-glucanase (GH16 family)
VGVGGGLLSLGLTAQGQSLIWSKATVKYGVVEARIWGPGSGRVIPNWPAFWMTTSKGDWPTGGEIDIWEPIVGRPGIHLHYGHDPNHPTVDMHPAGDWTGWHTYAVNWQPNGMTFWWDGKAVGTITEGVDAALSPMWVILNHHPASPGAWAGTDGWPASVPAQVLVDYVRVWS